MAKQHAEGKPATKKKHWIRRWLVRLGIVVIVLFFLSGSFVSIAEHRTSQPQFCGSCHVMVPYYQSWDEDVHGAKLDVACVECHYAPGERTTIKAKFRGLSQVASYFSGRYGASRPRAHVSDASCLTSKCHGDGKFMDKTIHIGTVEFTHAKHLLRGADEEQSNGNRLAEIEDELRGAVGEERFLTLQETATQSGPARDRYDLLVRLCRQWSADVDRELLIEFSQLHHRKVRIAQLHDLQCTNCHSYNPGDAHAKDAHGGSHFQVLTTTCFTCHFNNEGFNTGTNRCLMCHSPPRGEITVHEELTAEASEQLGAPELKTAAVKMNHTEILAKKVDCFACHADAAQQDATVSRRDCERCHDQARFFADWKEPFTLDLVTHYHKAHIQQQRAKCLDCHSEISHKLVHNGDHGEPTDGFLTSVLANCTQCHPNHHRAQVNLLLGRGGIGVAKSEPNLMFGSRTNCTGCHIEESRDAHGGSVVKATESGCIACHGDRHSQTFEQWKLGLELVMTDAEEAYQNARKMLDERTDAPEEARAKASDLLASAEADLRLVKEGNGLHNTTYSIELLDSVTARCGQAVAALSGN